MTSFCDHQFEAHLTGYVKLLSHGLALPCYTLSERTNAWYVASCTHPGDHGGLISAFDVFDSEDIMRLPGTMARPVRVGDRWHDVFFWNDVTYVGTAEQLWVQLEGCREEIAIRAPLTLLDLADGARAADSAALARRAFSYLERAFGTGRAINWRNNTYLRLRLIRRAYTFLGANDKGAFVRRALQDLDIVNVARNEVVVFFPSVVEALLGEHADTVQSEVRQLAAPFDLAVRFSSSRPRGKIGEIDSNADDILSAAAVTGRKGIYCIGSFERHLDLYTQQTRALNLVAALNETARVSSGDSVAVIGGGIAGLTAAAGLMSFGCRVDVFEAGPVPMARLRSAHHRIAHPTIATWPAKRPDITTRLPFLEWHLGPYSEVAASLISQFESLKPADSRLLLNVAVRRIVEVATDLLMVKADVDTPETYRLAIIAIGSGEELSAPGISSSSYWQPDNLETEIAHNRFDDFVVSGSGDGGLIDTLRIVHRDFARGLLVSEMAKLLYGTPLAAAIGQAEANAATSHDGGIEILASTYSTAADELFKNPQYATVQDKLMTSLAGFRQLVFLADRTWTPPFAPRTAPIYKLLVAHARRAGKITYASGNIVETRSGFELSDQEFDKNRTKVIIRHGASPMSGLNSLLSLSEIEQLALKQRSWSDIVAEPAWKESFPAIDGFPAHDPRSDEFIESRRAMAERVVQWIHPDASLAHVPEGFEVTFPGAVPAILRDENLFGVATRTRTRPDPTSIRR